MTRLLLIFVLLAQMGCGVFLQTTAGTLVGSVGAELVKHELEKDEKDEAPQP
jgi:hypothetical protein